MYKTKTSYQTLTVPFCKITRLLIYQWCYFPFKTLPKYQTIFNQLILPSNKIKLFNKYISISILHIQNFLKPFQTDARQKFS